MYLCNTTRNVGVRCEWSLGTDHFSFHRNVHIHAQGAGWTSEPLWGEKNKFTYQRRPTLRFALLIESQNYARKHTNLLLHSYSLCIPGYCIRFSENVL
jgi:hypothetical protein